MMRKMRSLSQQAGLLEKLTEMPSYRSSESRQYSQRLNLPGTLLLEDRKMYLDVGVSLYEASVKGDWKSAKDIIDRSDTAVIWCSITENCETTLHVAASAKSTKLTVDFVKKLMLKMGTEHVELQNRSGNTALCLAAARGNVSIAKIIVTISRKLLDIPGKQGMLPLYIAALYGKYEMVKYLFGESDRMRGEIWTDRSRGWFLLQCVEADFYDIALDIVVDWPELANNYGDVLAVLARKPHAFREMKHPFISRVIDATS